MNFANNAKPNDSYTHNDLFIRFSYSRTYWTNPQPFLLRFLSYGLSRDVYSTRLNTLFRDPLKY